MHQPLFFELIAFFLLFCTTALPSVSCMSQVLNESSNAAPDKRLLLLAMEFQDELVDLAINKLGMACFPVLKFSAYVFSFPVLVLLK